MPWQGLQGLRARVGTRAVGRPQRTSGDLTLAAPAPGYTQNRDGALVLDTSIELLLKSYRERPEYGNGAGYRKLAKRLRRDHGIYVNQKKIYRLCREIGI